MTAVAERGLGAATPPSRRPRWMSRIPAWVSIPTIVATINAAAFVIARPGVNDLWAARARANAVSHGVGLTYWFSWFGGGSTPGNYSVLTPYLSALLSAEFVGAASAVAITLLCASAVRGTRHPAAATAVATYAAGVNLWSGRVPFLLGCAFGLVALIGVIRRQRVVTVVATILTVLSSPVSAAFLALGLTGPFLSRGPHRAVSAWAIGTVAASFTLVAVAFGTPGPQHFSIVLCAETVAALMLFLFARPPEIVRTVIWLSVVVALLMLIVPNGLGANFGRMIWFCVPVAVVALSARTVRIALLLVCPVLISGANLTVRDLREATRPAAATSYYRPLADELDRTPGLANYRLEVVGQTAHAAYDALLDHAMLARGWETQEDNHLNRSLRQAALDATTYKVWLDNNSVGYVAMPKVKAEAVPEYVLVSSGTLKYLHEVWSSANWALYRVADPTPIVAAPQTVIKYSQASLTIRSHCACTYTVRIRFSRYLRGDGLTGPGTATFANDSYGYTIMTTTVPGDYVLHGSVKNIFR